MKLRLLWNQILKKTDDRILIGKKYIRGEGIEIGALHGPLKVRKKKAKVKYIDRMSVSELRKQYPELSKCKIVEPDIIDNGETLATIQDNSQDFVIANHFLEHCQNPINALENMYRKLKHNGILFVTIPDKRFTFDVDREVTSYEHILRDYENPPVGIEEHHFTDWAKHVEKPSTEEEFQKTLKRLIDQNYSIHYHVWTQKELIEMISKLQDKFNFDIELIQKNGIEVIFVLRKINIS